MLHKRGHFGLTWAITLFSLLFLSVILAACTTRTAPAAKPTIKIGVVEPASSPAFVELVKAELNGLKLGFEEADWVVAGRKIELLVEDSEGQPAVALSKAKKLVESDKVQILLGSQNSTEILALIPYVTETKTPTLVAASGTTVQLATKQRSDWYWRISETGPSFPIPEAGYNPKKFGSKGIVVAFDNVWGKEIATVFEYYTKEAGGEIIQKVFVPFNTTDFAPYFAKFDKSANYVYGALFGPPASLIVRQFKEFGLDKQFRLTGGVLLIPEVVNPVIDYAEGLTGSVRYLPALDTNENKKFVQAYTQRFGVGPGLASADAYETAIAIRKALEAIKGDIENRKQDFLNALAQVKFVGPRGPYELDPKYHSYVASGFMFQVQKVNGKNQVVWLKDYPSDKIPISKVTKALGVE